MSPPRRRKRIDLVAVVLGIYTVAFLAYILFPILAVVVVSFTQSTNVVFPLEGLSLKWYARIWEYKPFIQSLATSIVLAFLSAAIGALLGVPAALWVARSRSAWGQAIANLLLAPISIPAIVLGFALLYFVSGLALGISFTSLLIAHTVVAVPYVSRTVLAVYRAIPPDLEEAAAILGATRWQTLRYTTLPLIRPGIFAGGLFAVLISLDNLPLSYFFGSATTNTLPVVMLSYMQNQFDPSIAAISTVQMMIAVAVLLIVNRVYGIDKLTAA